MRDYRTYAIRLAVEGGGQVKAELVSVGQSGEQSLKRIESAGDRASGGLPIESRDGALGPRVVFEFDHRQTSALAVGW